jgi:hypothetical protein
MVLYKAEGKISIAQTARTASAVTAPRSAPAPLASMRQRFRARGGNVSKNSGKRLPDSFSSVDFRMYSWATVITIITDDTFRLFVMRFLPYSILSTADVDLF